MADQKLTEVAVSNPVTTLADADLLYAVTVAGTPASAAITADNLATVVGDKLGLGTAALAATTDFAPAAQGVTNGNSHDHSGGDGGSIPETAVQFSNDGVGTQVNTLSEFYDRAWSATSVSGFALTNNGDGTVTIAAGEVVIRNAATETAPLKSWAIAQTLNIALTNNSVNYIVANYNSGSPNVTAVTTTADFNCLDKCLLYKCVRYGTTIKWVDGRSMGVDSSRKHRRILMLTQGYRRASGGILSEVGTRNIAVTAGKYFWALSEDIDTAAFNTQTGDTFTAVYRDGSGGFTRAASQTQINNTQYDPGTGSLATIDNNKYGVHWIYLCMDNPSTLYSIYGTAQYATVAEAEASGVPAVLPPEISNLGELIGRVIIQKSASAFSLIESAYITAFAPGTATNHNGLAGLQGGAVNDYYHMTATELSLLQSVSTTRSDTKVPAGFINQTDSSLSFDPSAHTFTITGTNFVVYCAGARYLKSTESVAFDHTSTGRKFIYYSATGVLSASNTAWVLDGGAFDGRAMIATINWDSVNGRGVLEEERHHAWRDVNWHHWAHDSIGARYANGLSLTQPTTSVDDGLLIESGEMYDEDIALAITQQNTCRVFYRNAAQTAMIWDAAASSLPFRRVGGAGTALQYDNAGTLTPVSNNYYGVSWIYATNATSTPIALVVGQGNYASLADARAAGLPTFPVAQVEWKLIYKFIFQLTSVSTTINFIESADYRTSTSLPGGTLAASVTASAVSAIPSGNLSSTNVEGQLVELDTEKVALSGGTMTGDLIGHTDTDYTTARFRNITLSTSDPSGGNNGDVWIKYQA